VLLAVASSLVTLKLADVAIGSLANTRQRHLLRLAPRAQIRHRSREFDYVFRTNQLGLRGADVPFEKLPGTFRIVVLGDSFVAGYGVADEYLMTKLLQENLDHRSTVEHRSIAADSISGHPDVEVVNVGRVGTSTIRELDIYESLGTKFRPDLVILAYYLGNDLAEIMQEQTHAELAGWHPDGWVRRAAFFTFPNLYLELAMVRQSRRQMREFAQRDENEIVEDVRREAIARGRDPVASVSNYWSLAATLRGDVSSGLLAEQRIIDSCLEPDRLVRALDPPDGEFQRAWGRTHDHLERLRQAVARDGARLVLVAIPAPFQLDRKSLEFHGALGYGVCESWLSQPPRIELALAEWAAREQIAYLDLTDRFRSIDKKLYFVEDVHWNPQGNAAAAQAICDFLVSRKLCP
jgi:hypothetical protein